MRYALVFCMMLFTLNSETPAIPARNLNKPTCSLDVAPKLQAYCLKKNRKERMRCLPEENPFKEAFSNTLRFVGNNIFSKLVYFLK